MTTAYQGQIVFTEIPAADPERAARFYEILLEAPLIRDDAGPNPVWMLPRAEGGGAPGHVYPGAPASNGEGMTAHFAITGELADAMDRVKAGGGEIVSEIVNIYVGAFFYAKDTEGNSLGIFKYNA